MHMTKKISIDDIAAVAGVSRGTVSRAFNEGSEINKKTRDRILKIASARNYFPNPSARSLAKGKTECVGIVVPDLKNPFMPEMVTAIEKSAKSHGLSALLAISDGNAQTQERILTRMASGQVDGILTTPCETPESVRLLNAVNAKVPVVCLKNFDGLRCSSVSFNDAHGIHLIIEHLYQLGHRRIAYLAPAELTWTVAARLEAYHAARGAFDLAYRRHIEIPADYDATTWTKILGDVFEDTTEKVPTALVAFDDIIALYAINIIEACGKKVPSDISVAGFDNIAFASIAGVPLTTAWVDRERLGEAALDILVRLFKSQIRGEELHHITLLPELVARRSTAPVRKNSA